MVFGSGCSFLRIPFRNTLLSHALYTENHVAILEPWILLYQARCWSPAVHLALHLCYFATTDVYSDIEANLCPFFCLFISIFLSPLITKKRDKAFPIASWLSHIHIPHEFVTLPQSLLECLTDLESYIAVLTRKQDFWPSFSLMCSAMVYYTSHCERKLSSRKPLDGPSGTSFSYLS